MLDSKPLLLAVACTAVLGGCQSKPASVCAKIDDLANKASQSDDASLQEMAQKMKQESSTCVTRMKKMEQSDPESFAEASECIEQATGLKDVVACFFEAALSDETKAKARAHAQEAAKAEDPEG